MVLCSRLVSPRWVVVPRLTQDHQTEAMIRALEAGGFPVAAVTAHGDAFPRLLPWPLKRQILGRRGSEWSPIVIAWAHREWPGASMTPDALWSGWERELDGLLASPGAELCDGAAALVARLARAGVPMAINTSSRREAVLHKRVRHEETVFQHMRCVVTGDDVSNGKPAPDSFLEAASRMGLGVQDVNSLQHMRSSAACQHAGVNCPDSLARASLSLPASLSLSLYVFVRDVEFTRHAV